MKGGPKELQSPSSKLSKMIVETIGRLLYQLIPSLPSLRSGLVLVALALVLVALVYQVWPAVCTFRSRIHQIERIPGPKCTSLILGNVPFDVLKSMIANVDHKNLMISRLPLPLSELLVNCDCCSLLVHQT